MAKILPLLHEEHEAEKLQVRGCSATAGCKNTTLSISVLLPTRSSPIQAELTQSVQPAVMPRSLAAWMISRQNGGDLPNFAIRPPAQPVLAAESWQWC